MATAQAAPSTTESAWTPPPGRVGNLSVIQSHTLEKFKNELAADGLLDPKRHDDPTLLRFLRARKFDLAAAKTMLVNSEAWRKEFKVDDISQNFVFKEKADISKYYPQYYHKTDKEGRPVYIERLGNVNLAEMYKISSQERLLQNLVYEYEKLEQERLPACSKVVGHPVETSCTVIDLGGAGIKQFWDVKNYLSETAKIGQDRYPERMGKFYVINAPWGFATVWSVIKGWLDPVTQAKIKVLGSGYQKELLESIDEESLPSDLGGKCNCAEGCKFSDAGPWKKPSPSKMFGGEEAFRSGVAT